MVKRLRLQHGPSRTAALLVVGVGGIEQQAWLIVAQSHVQQIVVSHAHVWQIQIHRQISPSRRLCK